MKPLFITGYMACGKTTFGEALAKATGCRFVDLDALVEAREGKTVKEIFADSGEWAFRIAERRALEEAAALHNCIVACGGGTPCFADNMDFMNEAGETLWLEASPERTMSRILLQPGKRPLLDGLPEDELLERIKRHMAERIPFYSKAKHRFSGERLEDQRQIDETVNCFLSSKIHCK